MTMHNPPHPGEFIREVYLEPFGISSRQLASSLGVSPSTLSRLLKGDSGISLKCLCGYPRFSGVLLRAGWRCKICMTYGWLAAQSIWMVFIAWTSKQLNQWLLSDAPALALRHAAKPSVMQHPRVEVYK